MIELTPAQRRALRADAHHLKPVVAISQKGLLPSVIHEIDRCLASHGLIKLRLYDVDRDTRTALAGEICGALDCGLVQQIGNLLVLWRDLPDNPAADAEKSSLVARRPRSTKPATKKQAAAQTEARELRRKSAPAPRRRIARPTSNTR